MDRKFIFLIFGLIVLIIQCANSNPIENDEDDYNYQGDPKDETEYDDDEFEDDDTKKSSSTTGTPTEEKEYITEHYVEIVEVGSSITLKCKGNDFDKDTLFMWHNESNIIVQGKNILGDKNRITFSQADGSITIKNIQASDDGNYLCRAFPKKNRYETKIELLVNGPPTNITIGHNQKNQLDISNEKLVYRVGEKDLRFKCNPSKSRPAAKITWNHNGNVIDPSKDHDISIDHEAGLLNIKALHAKHAGKYECDASNDRGNIKAFFELDVQFVPFFKHHHNYFNAKLEADAEVHCLYRSSPVAKSVKWFKGTEQIHANDKYDVRNDEKDHHDRTKLIIRNVNVEDLKNYVCEVHNDLGTKRENVTLGFLPSPPRFEGSKYINGVLFTDWIVKSHQELTALQILFFTKANGWNRTDALITKKTQNHHNEWRVQGSIYLEAGDWEISGRAKNTEGWSDDRNAEVVHLKLPRDEIESGKSTSAASSVTSTICGLVAMLIARYFV